MRRAAASMSDSSGRLSTRQSALNPLKHDFGQTFKSTGCYRLRVWSGSFAGLGRYAHLGLTLPTYDH